MKKLAGGVRTALAQYRELAASQFASDLTMLQNNNLQMVSFYKLLKQKQYAPMVLLNKH